MNWQEQIDEIMDVFDFEKVQKTMAFLDWRWADNDNQLEVPTRTDLKKQARCLLKSVIEDLQSDARLGTGGFEAVKRDGQLSLIFVLEEWSFENDAP